MYVRNEHTAVAIQTKFINKMDQELNRVYRIVKDKPSRLKQLIPAYQASIIDVAITAIHQSPAYWAGDLSKANEGNPIGGPLMEGHISGLFVISGIWWVIIGIAGYYLPKKLSRIFLLFTVIAHSYGTGTWLSDRYGFWWTMTMIICNTITYIVMSEQDKELQRWHVDK